MFSGFVFAHSLAMFRTHAVCRGVKWRGFKFTPCFNGEGVRFKWEATCYIDGHKIDGDAPCRRTLTFRTEAEEELTIRRLKFWCVMGRTVPDRTCHRDEIPYRPAELPTEAALDAW